MADDLSRERIAVVAVHGIGEQRRFEHIDGQVRSIVAALRLRPSKVTVDIASATGAAFRAEQDTWSATPTVKVFIDDLRADKRLQIDFHEVWWADVNEPYSLTKQLRFWWWGLTVWLYPDKLQTTLRGASAMRPPAPPGGKRFLETLWVRTRLFGVAFVAVLGAASIGMVTFFAERVLNLRPPNVIRVFVNYVAGVKLYNQKTRRGAGFSSKRQDFLDTLTDPPRVSVRRRMIRALATVAMQDYDRWYVLAHSLGTVVAFNGLMENAEAWPGYFDADQWELMTRRRPDGTAFAGPARPNWVAPQGVCMPARPVWADPRSVAYRSRIFDRFHGLLTFGSPLEKFAALWPARVPISCEPAFRPGTAWLNVYDPVDPVSGVLRSFDMVGQDSCPKPDNIGYSAGPLLLLNHLQYLDAGRPGSTLADGVAEWLVTGNPHLIRTTAGAKWYAPGSSRHKLRTGIAYVTWLIAVVLLGFAGGLVLPVVLELVIQLVWLFIRYGRDFLDHGLRLFSTG
jgi:hypothetical protein